MWTSLKWSQKDRSAHVLFDRGLWTSCRMSLCCCQHCKASPKSQASVSCKPNCISTIAYSPAKKVQRIKHLSESAPPLETGCPLPYSFVCHLLSFCLPAFNQSKTNLAISRFNKLISRRTKLLQQFQRKVSQGDGNTVIRLK